MTLNKGALLSEKSSFTCNIARQLIYFPQVMKYCKFYRLRRFLFCFAFLLAPYDILLVLIGFCG